jgi:hypothetical protein
MNRKSSSIFASFRRKGVLAIPLAAGALLVSSSAASAAPREPVDPGVRCAAQTGPGSYEFYLPGERAVDKDGNKWVCGPDGKWFRDYSALTLSRATMSPVPVLAALAR